MAKGIPVNPAPVAPLPPKQAGDDARGGIALMALAVFILPVMDGIAKFLGTEDLA